ncbi:permeases of the drug/metabolite transporter (DMT) superfamily [Nautilia profundicola AmH]|uniref:Permeases of the drug/metabolite transporter (DMT) superfamily n=1 Tax=Nautilia profundicola (strain ATCC BAA-1463 / DSM 18972 / AmH) TaxID=598659 RepID=B9L8P0_NAUPA|nr:DMT family transporter [Nautilia profundicola]ACM92651.1 permeases of the drug/metabolite transporter (DMT) superfamily [Nautilia profundicola AmH]
MINFADFLLLIVAIFWGITFKLVQNAIADIPVFMFLFLRFFLAFLLMFIIFYKKISFDKNSIKAAFILGIFNFLVFSFQTFGLLYSPSSVVAFITGLYVILTPIVAFFLFKKHISIYAIIGVILAFLGIYLLTGADISGFGKGEILTLISTVFVAFHINYTDIYSKKYNLYTLVTFQFLAVGILSLIFVPFEKGNITFSKDVLIALIVTVLFATVFAYFIQTYAQKFTTPTKTAIIFAMEPVSAAIFGYFYGEHLSFIQIIGAVLVIFAMLVAETGDLFFRKIFKFS